MGWGVGYVVGHRLEGVTSLPNTLACSHCRFTNPVTPTMSTTMSDVSTGTSTALPSTSSDGTLRPTQSQSQTASQPLPPAHVFQSTNDTSLLPSHPSYKAHGDIPNTPLSVSIISTILGGILFTSFTLAGLSMAGWIDFKRAGWSDWARPQLGIYLGCLAGFHLLEFWITASWNPDRLSVDGESVWASRQGVRLHEG
jgi:hypothetical protein